jgi:hypothetical protein
VRPVGERVDLLEQAEVVRLLHDERRDVLAGVARQRFHECRAALGIEGQRIDLDALGGRDRARDLDVARIDGPGDEHLARARLAMAAHGHEHGFGERRGAFAANCSRRVR